MSAIKSRFRDPTAPERTVSRLQPRPIKRAVERHPQTPRKRGAGRRGLRCVCFVAATASFAAMAGLSFVLLTRPAASTLRGPVVDVHAAVALAATASEASSESREALLSRVNELRATAAALTLAADAAALSLGGTALPVATPHGEGRGAALSLGGVALPVARPRGEREHATRPPEQRAGALVGHPLLSAWQSGSVDWHNLVKQLPAGADVAFLEDAERETLDYASGHLLRWHDYGPLARFSGCDILRDCCMVHSASAAECKRNELCGWCAATSLCFSRSNPELPERVRGAVEHACAAQLEVGADPAPAPRSGLYTLVQDGVRREKASRAECSVVVDAPAVFIGLNGRAGMYVLSLARACDRGGRGVSLRPCTPPFPAPSFPPLLTLLSQGCTTFYRSSTSAPLRAFATRSAEATYTL
jgi:hypothetical protein